MKVSLNLQGIESEKESRTDLLPAGDYVAKIVEVEGKAAASGSGHYLQVLWEVVQGEHTGKRFQDFLNVIHSNADAQRIALARLKGILEKGGHRNPNFLEDTNELLGLTLLCRLVQETRQKDGKDLVSNNIKTIKSLQEGTGGAVNNNAAVNTPPTPPAPSVGFNNPPPAAPPATPPAPPAATPPGAFPWGQPK